jgi:hypothetical protein
MSMTYFWHGLFRTYGCCARARQKRMLAASGSYLWTKHMALSTKMPLGSLTKK